MLTRTPKNHKIYLDYLATKPKDFDPFADDTEQEKIKEYTYWTVYRNKFPYDVEDHLLVVIKTQHAKFKVNGKQPVPKKMSELGWWEYRELEDIHAEYQDYQIVLNPLKHQSVRTRLHFHLIK